MPAVPPIPGAAADRIRVKRIYRAARVSDGNRVLVDRLWPRGMSKDRARLHSWCREIAPSDELRRWLSIGIQTAPPIGAQKWLCRAFGAVDPPRRYILAIFEGGC